jgi:hypothetical protein
MFSCARVLMRPSLKLLLLFCCWSSLGLFAHAQNELQSKAARITRIAQVTTWPTSKLSPNTPLVIGVYGADSITDYLEMAVQGRRLKGRDVLVKRCSVVQEVVGCHVLFISRSEEGRLRDVLRRTTGEPILTIGETDNFMAKGGIVFLTMIGGSAQFTFDVSNLKRSRLEIDPETLALANPPPQR